MSLYSSKKPILNTLGNKTLIGNPLDNEAPVFDSTLDRFEYKSVNNNAETIFAKSFNTYDAINLEYLSISGGPSGGSSNVINRHIPMIKSGKFKAMVLRIGNNVSVGSDSLFVISVNNAIMPFGIQGLGNISNVTLFDNLIGELSVSIGDLVAYQVGIPPGDDGNITLEGVSLLFESD